MSSAASPAAPSAVSMQLSSAGDFDTSGLSDRYQTSLASAQPRMYASPSGLTPAALAVSASVTMTAADMSTSITAFRYLGYGVEMNRLSAVTVISSSAVRRSANHEYGFEAAISFNPDISSPIDLLWTTRFSPAEWAIADSMRAYMVVAWRRP